ncbi:GGDEF domain-containing protein [Nitratireductor basaltis]|uniref:diguanylate cyclase n=1 Tax=Nitratireductor basaltis TaxID=472175 RepID=A0A084UBY1_9HYPH|nr:diguanylate cyclase [Nitratireductor basaltis]KFB10467.1 Diguanylate cyclase (GGDEF) domain-containing protein precursor [Nitratireductor basaltis]
MDAMTIATGFLRSLGLAALVGMSFGALLRLELRGVKLGLASGALFGFAAVAAMADPIRFQEGVIFDARTVLIVLSAPMGGPIATVVGTALAAAYRAWLGGVGATAGVSGLVLAGLVSLIYYWRWRTARMIREFGILGFAGGVTIFTIFLMPRPQAMAAFETMAFPYILTTTLGTILVGIFLTAEKRRHDFARALKHASETDALTKVFNRRKLDRLANKLENRAAMQQDYAVIMFDIDHFKRVNDTYGHAAGDAVLTRVAEIVSARTRNMDQVVRYGGEEIAVILPDTNEKGAATVAQQILKTIAGTKVDWDGADIAVTVSAGVAASSSHGPGLVDVVAAADQAMYAAKRDGRNRVQTATTMRRLEVGATPGLQATAAETEKAS